MKYLLSALLLAAALPAAAQGNNLHHGAAAPAPAAPEAPAPKPDDWLGRKAPVPAEHVRYQQQARPYCAALDSNVPADGDIFFSCGCAVDRITVQSWSDYDYANSGPFMPVSDAKLIADTISSASDMNSAANPIYYGISEAGDSILSFC